jgi:aspartate/methionine/tyrosine aminotransferase
MKIREFGVEIWMDEFENHCHYNLAETCVQSLTLEELLDIAGKKDTILAELLPMKMTYGAINGSIRLRENVANLFDHQTKDNILITHGCIGANALVHATLVSAEDRVISVLPTYQQHYSIPESIGADVQILKLREENNFLPDLAELKNLATNNTRLICINNPNNPTGSLMDEEFLLKIVDIARQCDSYILCDEVYRGIDQAGNGFTKSIADLYEKGISTGSMSKSFSLAGLRLGWIVGATQFLDEVRTHRDYNTISVGLINDHLAAIALENSATILARSRSITRNNLAILDEWVTNEPLISYIKPQSATVALLKYELTIPSRDLCIKLLESKGVLFTPGSALDMEGYLRIGFANDPEITKTGLAKVSEFLKELSIELGQE